MKGIVTEPCICAVFHFEFLIHTIMCRYSVAVNELRAIVESNQMVHLCHAQNQFIINLSCMQPFPFQLFPSSLPPLSVLHLMLYTAVRLSSSDPLAGQDVLENLHRTLIASNNSGLNSESEESSRCLLFCKVLWLKADCLVQTMGQQLQGATEARNCYISCLLHIDQVLLIEKVGATDRNVLLTEFKVCIDDKRNDLFIA